MMVADQWRKRLNSTNIVGCNSREHRAKKRNSGLQQYDSNMKSYISLEWDGNHKRVVAKREQVGISWRDLRPYSSSKGHNVVADVFTVPREIYDLENLEDVLSYEIWNTHLSEDERGHLMQYLPTGSGAEQVLQALLSGDNFHFGSPFLNWGASLCSGELHPDVVLQQEQCVNTEKKTYYAELHKYHNDMIGCLKKLKDKFESCRDPEKEIVQKIWRSRYEADKKLSTSANDSKFHVLEDNVTATSESGSWVAEEKTCSSDNQNSSVMKGEYQNRVRKKGFKENGRSPLTVSDDMLFVGAKSRKGDKLHKQNIHSNDGAKYMSYVKISKKQHDIVKSMKQSGKSIQSRSLNRVLGNIDSFNVQPYRVFVEEEQKKLYEHWLQVATKVLPAAYENWRELQRLRQQMTKSLELDLKNRSKILIEEVPDDDSKSHKTDLQDQIENGISDQIENGISDHVSTPEDDAKSISGSPLKHFTPEDDAKSISGSPLKQSTLEDDAKSISGSPLKQSTPEDDDKSMSGSLQKQSTPEDDGKSMSGSPQNQSQQQFSGGDELNPMAIDLGENVITRSDHASSNASDYSENADTADVAVSQGVNLPCSGDVWPEGNMSHSYYDSNTSHEFTSDGGMSLAHEQVNEEQRTHLINLESEMPAGDTGKDMVHRQSEDASFRQSSDGSFGSYTNQGRNELFQSLFKSPDGLTYHHEQKQNGLNFQSPNNIVMEEGHFSRHFQEQRHPVLPMEQRHPMLPVEQQHPMLPVEQRHSMLPVEQRHPSLTMEQRHLSLSMEQRHASLPMEQRHLSLPMEQRHPSLPMEQLQKRANQVYVQQNISENVYSDGGRFLIPRQEPSTPVNMQDWSVNSVRMQPPIQSHLSGVQLLSQNWFSGEHNQVRGGWTGSDSANIPSQSIGSGSNGDQSLYSVLSHCNQLRPSSPYHSVVSTEQFLPSRTYGMMGGVGPSMSNVLPQSAHSLDYMSGREAAASLMPDDMGWMALPHQNSSLHDPMGKPYLRSWNQ